MRLLILLTVVLNPAAAAVLSGSVRDLSGAPTLDSRVTLCAPGSVVAVAATVTDGEGAYSFFDVPAGTYDLVIEHAGFSLTRVREIRLTEGVPKAAPPVAMNLPMCGMLAPESLRFSEGHPGTGSLSGIIIGRNRRPIRGALVSAVCIGKRSCAATTSTDARGGFELSTIAPGYYLLSIEKQGYFADENRLTVHAGMDSVLPPIALDTCQLKICPHREKIIRCE